MVDPVDEEDLEKVQLLTSVLLTNVHGPGFIDLYQQAADGETGGVTPDINMIRG